MLCTVIEQQQLHGVLMKEVGTAVRHNTLSMKAHCIYFAAGVIQAS